MAVSYPVDDITISGEHAFTLTVEGAIYQCSLGTSNESCAKIGGAGTRHGVPHGAPQTGEEAPLEISPDRKLGAFIRDWNLWVRNLATGAETQLTTDGVNDWYATDNAGWQHSNAAILLWSPDSTKMLTFQQDQRKTGEISRSRHQLASRAPGVEISAGRRCQQ